MPTAPLRIALAQACPTPRDLGQNLDAAAALVTDAGARGARLVVFPELFLTGYELPFLATTPTAWLDGVEDRRLDRLRRACDDAGITAILGAALREPDGERRIAAPIIGPDGALRVSTKEHLCGAEETSLFVTGTPLPPFDVAGWRVAIGICFDVARPAHAEAAARAGADLYVASSFYWQGEERRSDLHLGARAMDNRIFAALANYAGSTGGRVSSGRSGALGPTGDVLARTPDADPALLVVDLDPAALAPYR